MLDEEGRLGRPEEARRREPPADDGPVGAPPFAGDRVAEIGAGGAERGQIGPERVGRDRPGYEPATHLEHPHSRHTDPRPLGERPLEDPDELEVGVTEPDKPVEGPERVVPAAAGRREAKLPFELRRPGDRRRQEPRRALPSDLVGEAGELPRATWVAELRERLLLDLPDPLAAHAEFGADLRERPKPPVIEGEAEPKDPPVAAREGGEEGGQP